MTCVLSISFPVPNHDHHQFACFLQQRKQKPVLPTFSTAFPGFPPQAPAATGPPPGPGPRAGTWHPLPRNRAALPKSPRLGEEVFLRVDANWTPGFTLLFGNISECILGAFPPRKWEMPYSRFLGFPAGNTAQSLLAGSPPSPGSGGIKAFLIHAQLPSQRQPPFCSQPPSELMLSNQRWKRRFSRAFSGTRLCA